MPHGCSVENDMWMQRVLDVDLMNDRRVRIAIDVLEMSESLIHLNGLVSPHVCIR